MIESEFTIIEPKKSILLKILASAIFTGLIAYVIYIIRAKVITREVDILAVSIYLIWLFCFILFVIFIALNKHSILFNFKEMKVTHAYELGVFKIKEKWQLLVDVKYISIYAKGNSYNTIMYYEEHNFLKLFSLNTYDAIIEQGVYLSDKLNVKLLDATIKDDENHWVDKSHYKDTGKVKYLD